MSRQAVRTLYQGFLGAVAFVFGLATIRYLYRDYRGEEVDLIHEDGTYTTTTRRALREAA